MRKRVSVCRIKYILYFTHDIYLLSSLGKLNIFTSYDHIYQPRYLTGSSNGENFTKTVSSFLFDLTVSNSLQLNLLN